MKGWWCLLLIHLGGASYLTLVDEIEDFMSNAIRLHRSGQGQAALQLLQKIRENFQAAIQLEPALPDAYMAFAQAMLASNHLEESSEAWESALQRMDEKKDPRLFAWAKGRLRWSRYGQVSMKRDALYANGQGDLVESQKLVEQQLQIYPDFPSRHHDLATIQVMLSDFLVEAEQLAVGSFKSAQISAWKAWMAGLLERNRSQSCEKGEIFYDWSQALDLQGQPRTALVALKAFTDGYVATFHEVGLSGDDGLIVDEAKCQIFVASAGLVVNLAQDLQLLEIWGDPATPTATGPKFKWFDLNVGPNHGAWEKPMQVKQAASLVQFAGTSHFHIMTEVFGRLWLLRQAGVLEDPETRLVMPKPSGFLAAGFKMLAAGLQIAENRMIHWTNGPRDVLLRAEKLYFADWKVPIELGRDGGHCPTPVGVLHGVKAALEKRLSATQPGPAAVVYIKRKKGDMRSTLHNENELEKKLRASASAALDFVTFTGQLKMKATARLFARARVIVGIHGGALANILFCNQDVQIFELGFRSPFAGHYRYLASALNLTMTLLPLAPDARGIASQDVKLADFQGALRQITSTIASEKVEL